MTGRLALALVSLVLGQEGVAPPAETGSVSLRSLKLVDGAPVRLQLIQTLSTSMANKKAKEAVLKDGDTFSLAVMEDVKVQGFTVIRAGAEALGTIHSILPRRRLGRAGKLEFTVDWVEAVDKSRIAVRAERDMKGQNRYGSTTVLGVFFGVFGLLKRGKDVTIQGGQEVTAFIDGTPEVLLTTTP